MDKALVQVLGAVAYGELKAYELAKAEVEKAVSPEQRRRHRIVAAEELRHHKGFVGRLKAMGADPDRAMRPFRVPLDRYHAYRPTDPVEAAMFSYLGEGVADDLLSWLRKVADPDTASFIDTVIEDEVGHEAAAAADLRSVLESQPGARLKALTGATRMVTHMLWSGRTGALPLAAFLRLGRADALLASLISGQSRRVRAVL